MNASTTLSTRNEIKNGFVGAHLRVRPGRHTGLPLRAILCLFLILGLTSCKININIFGEGTVQTASGSINCTSDGSTQSGDCTQTYNVDENNVACDPQDPDCTVVTSDITETYVATPNQDDSFDGFADACGGAGLCSKTISQDNANQDQAVTIEAHFDPEPTPQDASYTYNALGQRQSKTVGGVTTYYLYDLNGNLLDEVDASGNSIKAYVYLENELVAWVEPTGDTSNSETQEQVFYPLNDHLGQPFFALRADEKITHEQYTNPFGKLHAQYRDATVGIGPLAINQRFPGQYYDEETGYSQNWNRDYDPSTGRYLQSDPIGLRGGLNTFAYAGQNPIMFIDPMGLMSQQDYWNKEGWCVDDSDGTPHYYPCDKPPSDCPEDGGSGGGGSPTIPPDASQPPVNPVAPVDPTPLPTTSPIDADGQQGRNSTTTPEPPYDKCRLKQIIEYSAYCAGQVATGNIIKWYSCMLKMEARMVACAVNGK